MTDIFLTKNEVASLLGVNPKTISNWVSRRYFPSPVVIARTNRWYKSQLHDWLSEKVAETDSAIFVYHDMKDGSGAFRMVKPRWRTQLHGKPLAVFQTSDGKWHTRPDCTQTVYGAGHEMIELSCEDSSIEFVPYSSLPVISTSSDDEGLA